MTGTLSMAPEAAFPLKAGKGMTMINNTRPGAKWSVE